MSEFDPLSPGATDHVREVAQAASPDLLALTREDAAAILATYRTENRRPRQWLGVATGIGGLFSAGVLINLGEHFHWPEALAPVFFIGGWAVLLLSLVVVARRERQLREQYQVNCPSCGAPLLDGSLTGRGVARAELAIATGNCPRCGAHFLAP